MNANELIEDFAEAFGDRLRSERKRLGLSQAELAELAGVRKQAQMHYEAGHRSPQAEYLYRLGQAGVDVAYVLTGQIDVATVPAMEAALLERFRIATSDTQRAVLSVLGVSTAGSLDVPAPQNQDGPVRLNVASGGHIVTGSKNKIDGSIRVGSTGKRSKASK
ncbi:XRE family transcriptional regulator [Mesorhizobium sp. M00.F.Ca.ET.151.01.1.1]|nr:XRE family transcriptional regulator [bacterium M00.F.Ca.ET.199.01.1.1]TGT02997.1 XRE family transcriptional regulator [bacterium M00.F.Ca.ET.177.01.1.1]TGT57933.1 XRE family transcriptional regulator [Mesorhizobium sp. M00.F.Ca.ET.170.01.1.1]TGU06846.1 XRE family transcriptional regulator [bacterium M00.F.Ca.ET.163.01.1.1]TGU91547.1 XRE family transcriptional regulator [Mesorhizobium sp. M00.F.Ca.ET.151.01.1.1]TGV53235.1 XRE family transcriptional regulator [bacterium M00.F.Ca.ET.141.01.1.